MFHVKHWKERRMIDIINLVLNNGNFFAMIACIAMAYYIKNEISKNNEMVLNLITAHEKETRDLQQTIAENTMAIQHLADKLGGTDELF